MPDTQVQEKPILFSGEMVRAILEGRKTQTRRPVKQAVVTDGLMHGIVYGTPAIDLTRCPFGVPGDRLWVRETHKLWDYSFEEILVEYRAIGTECVFRVAGSDKPTNLHTWPRSADAMPATRKHWRPSIHMPRWACRLTLKVTDVRVERIQDMSSVDAIQEGVYAVSPRETYLPIQRFIPRWDAIYAKKAPWDTNPWVWVVSFERETS